MIVAAAPLIGGFADCELAGVEFYSDGATAPPGYNGTDGGCGVLLLWTREK